MKLKVIKTEFFVNEKKESVTCIITGYVQPRNVNGFNIDLTVQSGANLLDRKVWYEPDRIQGFNYFKVEATTRCKNGDVFDAAKGRKIAKQKARIKMYKEATKLCVEAYHLFANEMMDDMIHFEYMNRVESLDYEKNVLEITLPEKITHKDKDQQQNEYTLCEEQDGVGYMRLLSENANDFDVLYWEETRRELLEKLNEDENVSFEGKNK